MRAVRLLTAAALAAGMVGCTPDRGTEPTAARTTASTPATAVSTATSAAPVTTLPAAPPGGATDPTPRHPAGSPPSARPGGSPPSARPGVTPSPFDGDRGGDLVRGVRTLRGVVERDGAWVLLRVAGERWVLLGERPGGLATGATVEVRGTVATPPPGCPVERALAVTRWQ